MALIDRGKKPHNIFCYLINPGAPGSFLTRPANYGYRYRSGFNMVALIDRFSSRTGALMHVGPNVNCSQFTTTLVHGFVSDDNAMNIVMQYQWFDRNPSIITNVKDSVVSFLENASKSDINLTASFAGLLGIFSSLLGRIFGFSDTASEDFKNLLATLAYIFQQGKGVIQEKDILSFGGMETQSTEFSFSKVYITLTDTPYATSVDQAIADAVTLKLFPDLMAFSDEDVRDKAILKKYIKCILASLMCGMLKNFFPSTDIPEVRFYYEANIKNKIKKQVAEKHKDKPNDVFYASLGILRSAPHIFNKIASNATRDLLLDRITLMRPDFAALNTGSTTSDTSACSTIASYLLSTSSGNIDVNQTANEYGNMKTIDKIINGHQVANITLHIEDDQTGTHMQRSFIRFIPLYAVTALSYLITNIEEYIDDTLSENNETWEKIQERCPKFLLTYLNEIGYSINNKIIIDLNEKTEAETFREAVRTAMKELQQEIFTDENTTIFAHEKPDGTFTNLYIYIDVSKLIEEGCNVNNPIGNLNRLISQADTVRKGMITDKVVQFLSKFGVLIIKPPGGYHFIHDYKAIVAALVHGSPCVEIQSPFEALESITYKIAYYGFVYRNVYRNVLGHVDTSTGLNSASIQYLVPSSIHLESSETFTYSSDPIDYSEMAIPTWTKMTVSFVPINNYIFFFGNYSTLNDLYEGLGLNKMLHDIKR